jgi:hypothetical protein
VDNESGHGLSRNPVSGGQEKSTQANWGGWPEDRGHSRVRSVAARITTTACRDAPHVLDGRRILASLKADAVQERRSHGTRIVVLATPQGAFDPR